MTNEWIQLAFYAGFAVLGWWLRHKGIFGPNPVDPAGSWPMDQRALIELLKALLDRLAQLPPSPTAQRPAHVAVPLEPQATSACPPTTRSGEQVGPP